MAAIVDRLDRLPLAIELASGRLDLMSLETLSDRLDNALALLRGRRRDQPDRQTTLEGAIAWSWDLLDSHEKAALTACTVFHGGFTLEAAEAVLDCPEALDLLHALWDKSLLSAHAPGAAATRWFFLLDSVRAFAAARLPEDERASAWARHAAITVATGETLARNTEHPGGEVAREALRRETDNLLAVWRRYRDHQPDLAVRAVLCLREVWFWGGLYSRWIPLCEAAAGRAADLDPKVRAPALVLLGHARDVQARYDEAIAAYDEGIAQAKAAGDAEWQARGYAGLGSVARMQDRLGDAEQALRAALEIARGLGPLEGTVLRFLAGVMHRTGRHDEAAALAAEALAVQEAHGSAHGANAARQSLAGVHHAAGRLEEARVLYEACGAYARERGSRLNAVICAHNLGVIALELGETAEARERLAAVVDTVRAIGATMFLPEALLTRGLAEHHAGDLAAAQASLGKATSSASDPFLQACAWGRLATLEADLGDAAEAARCLDTARGAAASAEADKMITLCAAMVALAAGDAAPAREALAACRPDDVYHLRIAAGRLRTALVAGTSPPVQH